MSMSVEMKGSTTAFSPVAQPNLPSKIALLLDQCKTKDVSQELEQFCCKQSFFDKASLSQAILNSDLAKALTAKSLEEMFKESTHRQFHSQEVTKTILFHPKARDIPIEIIQRGLLNTATAGNLGHLKLILKHPSITSFHCGEAYVQLIESGHKNTAQAFKYLHAMEFGTNIEGAFLSAIRHKNYDACMELLNCFHNERDAENKTKVIKDFVYLLPAAIDTADEKGDSIFMRWLLPLIDFKLLEKKEKIILERFFWQSKIDGREFVVDYLLNTPMKDWIKQDIHSVEEMSLRCSELSKQYLVEIRRGAAIKV